MLLPVLQGRLDNPGITFASTVATARDQTHAVAIPLDAQAVAVVLDLVQPVRAIRDAGRSGGKAEIEVAEHLVKARFIGEPVEDRHKCGSPPIQALVGTDPHRGSPQPLLERLRCSGCKRSLH